MLACSAFGVGAAGTSPPALKRYACVHVRTSRRETWPPNPSCSPIPASLDDLLNDGLLVLQKGFGACKRSAGASLSKQVTSNVLVWAPAEKLGTRGLTEEDLSKSPGVEGSERKRGREVDVRERLRDPRIPEWSDRRIVSLRFLAERSERTE